MNSTKQLPGKSLKLRQLQKASKAMAKSHSSSCQDLQKVPDIKASADLESQELDPIRKTSRMMKQNFLIKRKELQSYQALPSRPDAEVHNLRSSKESLGSATVKAGNQKTPIDGSMPSTTH